MIGVDTRIAVARLRQFPPLHVEEMAKQVTAVMASRTRGLEKTIEGAIAASGLGARLPRTMQSNVYPKGKPSLGAAGIVWSKATEVIEAFGNGVVIQGKDGGWLAIPTPEVAKIRGFRAIEAVQGGGVRGVGRKTARITPKSFQAATGLRLQFIYTGTQIAFLIATGVTSNNRLGFAPATKQRLRRGRVQKSFLAFWLIRQVTLRKRFDLAAMVAAERPQLAAALADAIARGVVAAQLRIATTT